MSGNRAFGGKEDSNGDYEDQDRLIVLKKSENALKSFKEEYEVKRMLSTGGSSEIFICWHKSTKQNRVLKKLKKKMNTGRMRDKMRQEADTLAKLGDHTCIGRFFGLFEEEGELLMVCDHYLGGDLIDFLNRHFEKTGGSIRVQLVALVIRKVLSALEHCHKNNIVHRDVKPENIMFVSAHDESSVKLIDFGESVHFEIGKGQWMKTQAGTRSFMAPELLKTPPKFNEKCDVWATGVTMFMMCNFKYPHVGSSAQQRTNSILKRQYRSEFSQDSPQAKFIRMLMNENLSTRVSATEALKNPFLDQAEEVVGQFGSIKASQNAVKNMRNYKAKSKLKTIVRQYVVLQLMSKKKYEMLAKSFQAMDLDNNGALSKKEFRLAMDSYMKNKDDVLQFNSSINIDDWFSEIDLNNDNEISLQEFLNAASSDKSMFCEINVDAVFDMFDSDNDEHITYEELKLALGTDIEDEDIMHMIKEADVNNDGEISKEEFKHFLIPDYDVDNGSGDS